MQRIYLGSNVFIALIRQDMGKPFKLMFQQVEDFLNDCPEKYIVVLSDITLQEIEKVVHYSKDLTLESFKELEIETEILKIENRDTEKASELRKKGMHKADALHATLAINSKCDVLLTFNKKHFELVQHLIEIKEPGELIY